MSVKNGEPTKTTAPCGNHRRYDRGECDYPKCGCDASDGHPEALATQTESRPEYDRGYAAAKGDLHGELSILRDANRQMMEALDAINRRASPRPDRTFDDCSTDLYWCASEARRVLS